MVDTARFGQRFRKDFGYDSKLRKDERRSDDRQSSHESSIRLALVGSCEVSEMSVEREAKLRELLLRKREESAAGSSAGTGTTQGGPSDATPTGAVAPSGEPKRRRKRWGDAKDDSSVPLAAERPRPSRWAKTVAPVVADA